MFPYFGPGSIRPRVYEVDGPCEGQGIWKPCYLPGASPDLFLPRTKMQYEKGADMVMRREPTRSVTLKTSADFLGGCLHGACSRCVYIYIHACITYRSPHAYC